MSIKIQYEFVFYIVILFFLKIFVYFIPFFISIIIHELFHGLFGIIYGLKIKSISIGITGLNIKFDKFDLKLFKKIIILLSGPISNLTIAVFCIFMNKEMYLIIVLSNFILFIFNIIPLYPLDGGKILFEIFNEYFKYDVRIKLIKIIYYIVTIILLLIIGYICINYANTQILLIGIYLISLANKYNYDNVIII